MEYIYPAFERGRIMRKELLWALRDYSYSALQLQYQSYPSGIISGCGLRTEEDMLCIGPGVIKCQDFIFLIKEEVRLGYVPTEEYIALKFRIEGREELPDYTAYETTYVLDKCLEHKSNEIEICRFKLKTGARLRTEYKDFYDIQTEYDTVNLANATWSAEGHNTLSKEITDCYAQKLLECDKTENSDIQFAYLLLQNKQAVNFKILLDYIARKTGEDSRKFFINTEEAFYKLEGILNRIRSGMDTPTFNNTKMDSSIIIWD